MVKLIALYRRPSDPKAFEDYYFGRHKPLAAKIPGLKAYEVYKVFGAPKNNPSDYYMVAELHFQDRETMMKALRSRESLAAAQDVPRFAQDIVSIFFAEEAERARG